MSWEVQTRRSFGLVCTECGVSYNGWRQDIRNVGFPITVGAKTYGSSNVNQKNAEKYGCRTCGNKQKVADCTAADLLRLARTCEEQLDPWPAIGRWLRDVAAAGNGYLKTSGYTLDDLAEMRAELWGQRPGPRTCCDGGPQWGHAWDCPKLP